MFAVNIDQSFHNITKIQIMDAGKCLPLTFVKNQTFFSIKYVKWKQTSSMQNSTKILSERFDAVLRWF